MHPQNGTGGDEPLTWEEFEAKVRATFPPDSPEFLVKATLDAVVLRRAATGFAKSPAAAAMNAANDPLKVLAVYAGQLAVMLHMFLELWKAKDRLPLDADPAHHDLIRAFAHLEAIETTIGLRTPDDPILKEYTGG